MKLTTRLALVLLALAVAVAQPWALAQEKEPAAAVNQVVELKKGDHILFYGDSLTDQARGPKGWVTIVRETLKTQHPDLGVEVSTFAVGGYCIVDRVKRVEQEVIAKKPTIVVIQGGVPDALRYKGDQFKTGLEELIERLRSGLERAHLALAAGKSGTGRRRQGLGQGQVRRVAFSERWGQPSRNL